MATIDRIRCEWTGGTGLPGVSTFYALPAATGAVAALDTFWQVVDAYLPDGVSVTTPNSGDSIESTTGELVGGWTSTGGATRTGTLTTDWAAGVGLRVTWQTNSVLRGRRVKGATFLAPLLVSVFDNNGTLDSTVQSTILAGANVLAAASVLEVWSRPTTPGGSDGGYSSVTSATIADRPTSLRTRRY